MAFFRGVWDCTQSYSEQFEWTRPCSCQDIKRYNYVYKLKDTWKEHNPIGDLCKTVWNIHPRHRYCYDFITLCIIFPGKIIVFEIEL